MSSDITEVIDDYCRRKYGHTNWAWTDTLVDDDQQRAVTENEKGETIGEIEGNIIFYYDDVKDMYRFVVYKNCEKGWKIDEIFEDEDEAIRYVDEYKEEFKLDDTSIKYVHEECTEEELKKYEEEDK
tara:strand:- start:31 stop:411 length:381 start_codon:yes stop_codon:yes gene_type:complete